MVVEETMIPSPPIGHISPLLPPVRITDTGTIEIVIRNIVSKDPFFFVAGVEGLRLTENNLGLLRSWSF